MQFTSLRQVTSDRNSEELLHFPVEWEVKVRLNSFTSVVSFSITFRTLCPHGNGSLPLCLQCMVVTIPLLLPHSTFLLHEAQKGRLNVKGTY